MRIVVVHTDAMIARIINLIFTDASHSVVLARSAREAIQNVTGSETDAVITEVDLPDLDGNQLCKELRTARYTGPILFVTSRSDITSKLRAFEQGADDYLVEPFEPAELLARVEASARRCRHMDLQSLGTVVKVGDAELLIGDLSFRDGDQPPVMLTPTEMRLLERLMRNAGITISRDTLVERTWGFDYLGDSNRVDVYIARLRKKIEQDPSRPVYLHTVRGSGYMFRAPDQPLPRSNEVADGPLDDPPVGTPVMFSNGRSTFTDGFSYKGLQDFPSSN